MIPKWNSFINGDCMDYLKEFPDNYFSLALVDPPYGGGLCDGGGCMGRWEKYHQNATDNKELGVHFNGRGRFAKYAEPPENLGGGTAQFYNRFGGNGTRFQKYKETLYERDAEMPEELSAEIGDGQN